MEKEVISITPMEEGIFLKRNSGTLHLIGDVDEDGDGMGNIQGFTKDLNEAMKKNNIKEMRVTRNEE